MASLFKLMIVKILICLEISLLFTSTMANDFTVVGFGNGSTKKFCGPRLAEALKWICNGEYNQLQTNKRSGADGTFDDYYNDPSLLEGLPPHYQSYAYLSKIIPDSAAIRPRVRREWYVYRGVYDECCQNACTINELKRYCRAQK
ncbi:LIRP-like isoform X2 [Contarinia nasturtii]|uniref:LIRP-like isoform X2 n=1 Tax=Contarinia nasturtii TaxID=265458 RepID=UPI0012D4A70A|nr:LIRP-like isoform X2 [Contarinia nasturtii]